MLLFIRPFNLFLKVILRTVHTILNIKPKQKIKKTENKKIKKKQKPKQIKNKKQKQQLKKQKAKTK